MSKACSTSRLRLSSIESKIWPAFVRASLAVVASCINPAFPRPPQRTCALIAHGNPTTFNASSTWDTSLTSLPLGTAMPASSKSSLAWYSNSFTTTTLPLASVPGPVGTQKLVLGWDDLRYGPGNPGDVQEVPVGQVLVDVVPGPATAPHREREAKTVVEASPVAEDLNLVYQQTADVHLQPDPLYVRLARGVQPARVSPAHIVKASPREIQRLVEVRCLVNGEDHRELLAREGILLPHSLPL